jgi:hypothetical protein
MKKLVYVLIFNLTFISFSQSKNCSDFKTGEFRYGDKERPEKIIRTLDSQIETHPETGLEIHASIEWTSDCSYVLRYDKILNSTEDTAPYVGQKVYVHILKVKKNKFLVKAQSKRIDLEIEFIKEKQKQK